MRPFSRSTNLHRWCAVLAGALLVAITGPARSQQADDAVSAPAPPPPPAISVIPGVAPAQDAPSAPATARFVLRAPTELVAGQPLRVEVVRQSRDGRPHDFRLAIEPEGLVPISPLTLIIDDAEDSISTELETVADPPGSGPHTMRLLLYPGESKPEIGIPRSAAITVTEAPPATPSSYAVEAPTAVERGQEVTFTVTRQVGVGDERVAYDIVQDGNVIAAGEVAFDAGNAPQTVDFSSYSECSGPLSIVLPDVAGQPGAEAQFTSPVPEYCYAEPPSDPWWWPWILIGLIPGVGLVWWMVKHKRGPTPPPTSDTADRETDGDKKDGDETPPAVELGHKFEMKSGTSLFPGGEPRLRGPVIAIRFHMVGGEGSWPDPLPLRETSDD